MKSENISRSGKYIYHPQPMHLHACNQVGASFESHIWCAAELGMRTVRFTGHDTRTGPKEHPVTGYDFSCGALTFEDYPGQKVSWEPEESMDVPETVFSTAHTAFSLCNPEEDWKTAGLRLVSSGKRHTCPIFMEPVLTLTFSVSADCADDAAVCFAAEFSQRPPEMVPARIYFVLGNADALELPPHAVTVPLERELQGRHILRLPLMDWVQKVPETVGGLDNAFTSLILSVCSRRGCRAELTMERLTLETTGGFDDAIQKQRPVAAAMGEKYGVQTFVTTEITGAGQDKNVYSTKVPVIDYAAHGYRVTQGEAIAHVRKYGGIFCWNHPFSAILGQEGDPRRRLEQYAARLIACGVYGASLMEVGFPVGRYGYGIEGYLRLWDLLTLGGVFITGCGDNDSHVSPDKWFSGQNFCSWIAAPAEDVFPIPEQHYIDSMAAGRLFAGDPTQIHGDVTFTAENGAEMGSIFCTDSETAAPLTLCFTMAQPKNGWECRIIVDGETAETIPMTDGAFTHTIRLETGGPVSFARVEVWNADGRCLLLTNPIYLVQRDTFAGKLPEARLQK